ncbi:MAG: hypothetical protein Q7J98_02460 [Kiritimatiellia bacterium]|nr:hypothetical protein [Kiritimatiellia bacterium]
MRAFRNSSAFHRTGAIIFTALLLLGAAVRIYSAWQLRHNLNSDAGIVALMAKHMAAGVDFPIFFYGQAYMGSLEPLVSALFCVLFGTSGFMVTLGTAFVGWLILLAVFAWARDAHSPAAGLAAMAYCVIGPTGFVHYQASPRGGYMVTILLSAMILRLISKLIINGHENSLVSKGKWFILGLLAGIGWWSNQLIVSAIFAAALMALVFLRQKIFSLNTLGAAIGFFIGSLPFWWWNVLYDWQSFEFAGSLGQTPFARGLKMFFWERLPDLLDLNHGVIVWRFIGAAVYLGAAVFLAAFLWKAVKSHSFGHANGVASRPEKKQVHLLTAFVFILVSALLFSTSHFALMDTSRYLLPLIPVIAVIFGVMTAELAKRKTFWLGAIPLVVVIANQAANLSWLPQRGAEEETYQRQIEECGRFLQSHQINTCYAPYGKHSWNFALREEIRFCDLPQDRYLPYVRRAELADKIAVFDNLGDINNFVSNYGGSASSVYTGETPIVYGFAPPPEGLAAIPSEAIESIRDSLEHDIFNEVTDGNIDTGWEGTVVDGDDDWLEIAFKMPQVVRMIRLGYIEYPERWQIAGQGENGLWKTLTPCVQTAGYLWSGPRPYWSYGLEGYRLECRLPPEKLKRLRIHRIQNGYKLLEIQLFSPAVAPESEYSALKNLVDLIRQRGLKRLYCDRWPANAVFRETQGAVATWLNPSIFGDCSLSSSNSVWFTPRTGILVHAEDAPLCRQILSERLIEMRRTKIGPWVLFDFSPCEALGRSMGERGNWKPEYGRDFELYWVGFACLTKNNKRWAAELVSRADLCQSTDKKAEAVALLQKACETWPLYPPAIERLAKITTGQGQTRGAGYWENEYKKLQPEIRAEIKFNNGIEFMGLSLSTNIVSAGDSLTARYYWDYPPNGAVGRPWVFVHFLNGENIIQDDHPLEKFKGAEYQPFPEVFVETRNLVVPKTAPEGEYQIRIGLYDAGRPDQKRFAAETKLPSRLNSAELPVKLTIIKPK